MRVIAVNGSPHPQGNTYLAIRMVFAPLEEAGIETEILQIGGRPVQGCIGCGSCLKGGGRCVLGDDAFLSWADQIDAADGLVLASPSYYGGMTGQFKCFLDRLFYQSRRTGAFRHKAGVSVCTLRRTGALSTIDQLNRFFFSSEMFLVPSPGPCAIHGSTPGEVLEDAEGAYILRQTGRNMAWLLKMKEASKEAVPPPVPEKKVYMNFIRKETASPR